MSVIVENPLDADRLLRRGSAPCIRYGSSALVPPMSPCSNRRDSFPRFAFVDTSPRSQQRSLQPRFVEASVVVKCGSGAPTSAALKTSVPGHSPRSPPAVLSSRGSGTPTSAASLKSSLSKQTPRNPEARRCDDERIAIDSSRTFARTTSGRSALKLPERTLQRRQTPDCSYAASLLSPGRAPCLPITPKSMSSSWVCHASSKIRTVSPPIVQHRRSCSNDTYGSVSTCYHEGSSKSSSGADDASQKETPVSSARFAEFSLLRRSSPDLVVDIEVEDDWIDPSRSSLKPLIFDVLGVSPHAAMQRMEKTHGGLNQGLWTVRDSSQEFVVKMVTCTRFMGLPTEAEAFTSLSRRAPKLADDPSISFPVKIFHCRCSDGQMKDLIAMRRVSGTCFADLILSRLATGRTWELGRELQTFGKFLAEFHERHKMQHSDLQPANIIYDERSRQFSLIDVAEMGNPRIKETDAEHFVSGLRGITKRHGSRAFEDCKQHFEVGFSEATS